ncbi:septum formation initiator [Enterococcus sp. 10A9_DIV0425]|uniref:Septum formation initiator n=1 Tax=Candidatus Enterococcus wittei TaxID=1987383 RepID=A0A242JVE2_9ENTE|nr:septum formation initiator family protein [Enterococcus sp. 10A9_DIV0425]OTP06864.1 septum formation initiator [Enterococcus sp. 10A9_DIV0425]THE15837.1 septum formation initiator family protein [Enterococcus hirae]
MTKKSNKIAALDTEYAKKKYVEFQQQQRQLIFRRRRLAAIFLGALVIFAVIGFQIFHDMQKMNTLNELKVEADTELRQLNEDVNQLNEDVTLLKDEDYVAKLARSKFFYSKDGEQVYPVPDSTTSNPTEGNDKTTSSTTAP